MKINHTKNILMANIDYISILSNFQFRALNSRMITHISQNIYFFAGIKHRRFFLKNALTFENVWKSKSEVKFSGSKSQCSSKTITNIFTNGKHIVFMLFN